MGGGSVGGGQGRGQGGCERRIEVFVKIQKKNFLGGGSGGGGRVGGGVRVDVNEIEVFVKVGGSGSGWGVRVDVNEELKFL